MKKTRIKGFEVEVIKEKDGSFAIACSSFGVYGAGKTLSAAKKDFLQALGLHLEVLQKKAVSALAI